MMHFFNVVVDVSIAPLQERFQTLGEVEEKFGPLVNFPDLLSDELTKQCETLSNTLSCGGQSDLDGRELALEMQSFPELPKANMTNLELLTYFLLLLTGEKTEGNLSKYVGGPQNRCHSSSDNCHCRKELLKIEAD